MKNIPQIKVYDIDYEFIIKNYLDKSLWKKEWTIFLYKNYKFDLSLSRINVKSNQIIFDLKLSSDLDIWDNSVSREITYSIETMDVDRLKNIIYNAMISAICVLEIFYIDTKDELYLETQKLKENEHNVLRQIAEDFLDSEDVSNDEIREAYIDYYVDKNETIWNKLVEIEENKKYTYLSDLYLILAEIKNDDELKEKVYNKLSTDKTNLIKKELEEFADYLKSDEYIQDMELNLEAI